MSEDRLLDLQALSARSSIGVRKLRAYLKDPEMPLPHYRIGGKILVRWSEFLEWAESFRVVGMEASQSATQFTDRILERS